jgi:hypothetical protein
MRDWFESGPGPIFFLPVIPLKLGKGLKAFEISPRAESFVAFETHLAFTIYLKANKLSYRLEGFLLHKSHFFVLQRYWPKMLLDR